MKHNNKKKYKFYGKNRKRTIGVSFWTPKQ